MTHAHSPKGLPAAGVRPRRRPPGVVVAPLKYTNDVVDFDHWDYMFITNCCKSLTLHAFDGPPATILDLGCGRGLWAIEAASQWQGSTVVGFDIEPGQPPLSMLGKTRKVKWVHGNLLDGLPFNDAQFDYVRMARMGLHVPADEWDYVLEEIARVLQPNGVFEMIEEDLMFPCVTLRAPDGYPIKPSSNGTSPQSSNTAVTTLSSPCLEPDSMLKSSGSKSSSSDALSGSAPLTPFEAEFWQPKPAGLRDHSRLKRAWEEMLDSCFLAPNLLSTLPARLQRWFSEIRSHTPLQVPMPPNSTRRRGMPQTTHGLPSLIDPDALFELSTLWGKSGSTDPSGDCASVVAKKSSQRGVSLWAPMHLARTVRIIEGCKEAIWSAYERLYGQDPSLRHVVRSAQETYLKQHFNKAQSPTHPLREYFERDWTDWRTDMAGRICLRESIRAELFWTEPLGPQPEWRNSIPFHAVSECEREREEATELCRSLRGFVCFKAPRAAVGGREDI